MTLYELWLVITRRWKLMVLLPVVCAVVCAGFLLLSKSDDSYTADARVVSNSQVQSVAGFASSEARQYLMRMYGEEVPDDAITIKAKGEASTMTTTVTVTGADADLCVEAANAVAEAANNLAEESFSDIVELPYVGHVEPASFAVADEAAGNFRYLLVAILGGLFLAVCIAVVLDMKGHPVKTAESVQAAVELPVLEILPTANGERLLANVRFASKKDELSSAYIVPAGDVEAAKIVRDSITQASASGGDSHVLTVECGAPLGESMQSAYEARKSDAVVVSVRQWVDTMPQLESAVAELKLADANLVGLVFVKDKLR